MNVKVEDINSLIFECIIHGGDSGGPYYVNEKSVIDTMKKFHLSSYNIVRKTIRKNNYIYTDIPQFEKKQVDINET